MDAEATFDTTSPLRAGAPATTAADSPRVVLAAAREAAIAGRPATLAIVVETEGSTYVDAGAVALFTGEREPVGWLSGGCLEPEIARHAMATAESGTVGWLAIDTRDDEDLLSGSTAGCRGRLRIALLPLRALAGIETAFAAWLDGGRALVLRIAQGSLEASLGEAWTRSWTLPSSAADAPEGVRLVLWQPSPELMLLGAGPETATLLPALHALGWRTTLVERRARWRSLAALADAHVEATPAAALATGARADAALVMHHGFELDREALAALADAAIPYVGLLGPARRREDLFRVLPATARAALMPRLRSPVGLHLGGQGAAAIALSIAAELQAWRHGLEPSR